MSLIKSKRSAPLTSALRYQWQQAVFNALIEYHPDRIRRALAAAQRAIAGRLLQSPTELQELLALLDALAGLQIVFPGSKTKIESTREKDIA